MIPECALQNIAHPHRNPQPGESVSFRKTYTPPVRGKADESSAHTSAPNSVRMPAATHTESTPPTLGTCRLISEGCTKIPNAMRLRNWGFRSLFIHPMKSVPNFRVSILGCSPPHFYSTGGTPGPV